MCLNYYQKLFTTVVKNSNSASKLPKVPLSRISWNSYEQRKTFLSSPDDSSVASCIKLVFNAHCKWAVLEVTRSVVLSILELDVLTGQPSVDMKVQRHPRGRFSILSYIQDLVFHVNSQRFQFMNYFSKSPIADVWKNLIKGTLSDIKDETCE